MQITLQHNLPFLKLAQTHVNSVATVSLVVQDKAGAVAGFKQREHWPINEQNSMLRNGFKLQWTLDNHQWTQQYVEKQVLVKGDSGQPIGMKGCTSQHAHILFRITPIIIPSEPQPCVACWIWATTKSPVVLCWCSAESVHVIHHNLVHSWKHVPLRKMHT